jgi:hypothetical protein
MSTRAVVSRLRLVYTRLLIPKVIPQKTGYVCIPSVYHGYGLFLELIELFLQSTTVKILSYMLTYQDVLGCYTVTLLT